MTKHLQPIDADEIDLAGGYRVGCYVELAELARVPVARPGMVGIRPLMEGQGLPNG